MVGWIALYYLLEVLKWLIIVRAVMSWFVDPYSRNPLVEAVRKATDPILRPLASVLPDLGGRDVSPLVAIFAIWFLQEMMLQALPL